MVIMECEPEFLQVIATLDPAGRLPRCLHGWQNESDKYAYDSDHDNQFNERESSMLAHSCSLLYRAGSVL